MTRSRLLRRHLSLRDYVNLFYVGAGMSLCNGVLYGEDGQGLRKDSF